MDSVTFVTGQNRNYNAAVKSAVTYFNSCKVTDVEKDKIKKYIENKSVDSTGKIKRLPNKFMCFRIINKAVVEPFIEGVITDNAQQEKVKFISHVWKAIKPEAQQEYQVLADIAATEHDKHHPNYKYKPKKKSKALDEAGPSLPSKKKKTSFKPKASSTTIVSDVNQNVVGGCQQTNPVNPSLDKTLKCRRVLPIETVMPKHAKSKSAENTAQQAPFSVSPRQKHEGQGSANNAANDAVLAANQPVSTSELSTNRNSGTSVVGNENERTCETAALSVSSDLFKPMDNKEPKAWWTSPMDNKELEDWWTSPDRSPFE